MKNVAAVGASLKVLGLPIDGLLEAVRNAFKNELFVRMNSLAAKLAYDQVPNVSDLKPLERKEPRVWMDGNTAVALGSSRVASGSSLTTR